MRWIVVGNRIQTPGKDRDRLTIATVVGGAFSENDIANLMAAAPELLGALEAAIPLLIRLGDFIGNGEIDDSRPGSLGHRCDVIGDARAAIRKAYGESIRKF